MKALTGIDFDVVSLTTIGERIYTLERLYNIREGLSSKDDTLPPRFLNEPLKEGPSKDHIVPLDSMLKDYYFVRGWDQDGVPTPELINKLGIEFKL